MSKRGDLKFILPKEGSSNVSLPKGFPATITKTIDLHIEDFLVLFVKWMSTVLFF